MDKLVREVEELDTGSKVIETSDLKEPEKSCDIGTLWAKREDEFIKLDISTNNDMFIEKIE